MAVDSGVAVVVYDGWSFAIVASEVLILFVVGIDVESEFFVIYFL